MCLGKIRTKKQTKKDIKKYDKHGYVKIEKWVEYHRSYTSWRPLIQHYSGKHEDGFVHADLIAESEQELLHGYLKTDGKEGWGGKKILCLAKPEWIVATADYNGDGRLSSISCTCKALIMPKFPKTKVTVREFRKLSKGKKVKKYYWEK